MKYIITIAFIISFWYSAHSQGALNDFEYNKEDLNVIFKEMGFTVFKFPVIQKTSQLCDFILEEYMDGKLIQQKSIIKEAKEKFEKYGIDWWKKYFTANKDSVYFHRFYFVQRDSTLSLKIKSHGYSTIEKISNIGSLLFDVRSLDSIKLEIDRTGSIQVEPNKYLLFLYANKKGSKEPLWCPSGLPKNEVIKRFDYVLYLSIKEYKD